MTLQELDTINKIAIDAGADFEEMLNIIGNGAADFGLQLSIAGKDTRKMRRICDEITALLDERR